jgi:hypothetical protein
MKIKSLFISAIAVFTSLLTGCATIVNGRFQNVAVNTQPPGAHCVLSNDKGQWQVTTPHIASVHRSANDLKIVCQKPGYRDSSDRIQSSAKKMILGNAVFGGVLGAGVDAVNGAGFSYPNEINLTLKPSVRK